MKLIVGLGNPGREYAHNRHNLGFMVVEALAQAHGLPLWSTSSQTKALITKGEIIDQEVILAKPQTFMNMSGEAVQALAGFYKVTPTDIWVVHDELDLPFGSLRVRTAGDSAGHNGLKSIMTAIGTREFGRFRLGIGNDILRNPLSSDTFVLQDFSSSERLQLNEVIHQAVATIQSCLSQGLSHQDHTF